MFSLIYHRIEESLANMESLLLHLPGDTCSPDMPLEEIIENISDFNSIEKTGCYDLDMDELRVFFDKLVCFTFFFKDFISLMFIWRFDLYRKLLGRTVFSM